MMGLLIIQDTGAWLRGFNYSGGLRPQIIPARNGTMGRIRRAETLDDYFATLHVSRPTFAARPILKNPTVQ